MTAFNFKKTIRLLIIVTVFLMTMLIFIRPMKIIGSSMEPTLSANSWIIINRLAYKFSNPNPGDIIIFTTSEFNATYMIKRVIAIEKDIIEIINGKVYVNDILLQEKYVQNNFNVNFEKRIIPTNSVFVLGDNRSISKDSRYKDIGFINIKNIIGKIAF